MPQGLTVVTVLGFLVVVSSLAAQPFGAMEPSPGLGLETGSVAWGDYDNDGDLDLAIAGNNMGTGVFRIYRQDTAFFTNIDISPDWGVQGAALAWGDYDHDGDFDLVVSGYNAAEGKEELRIYVNKGNGTFESFHRDEMAVSYGEVAWGDYDNDGDLDLVTVGQREGNLVLLVHRNDPDGVFNRIEIDSSGGLINASLAWGDYDNDGDLDLAVMGSPWWPRYLRIYRNEGGDIFTRMDIASGFGVDDGDLAWGDYDADGDLDLAVVGQGPVDPVFRLYRNDGGTFVAIDPEPGWGLTAASVAWADYDNDGDLDLAVGGHDSTNGVHFRVYANNGNGSFTGSVVDPGWGADACSLAWGDYDGDGDTDLAIIGAGGFRVYVNSNTTPNQPPAPVSSGFRAEDDGGYWCLRWDPATDDHTPQKVLRYQVVWGTNSGRYDLASTNLHFPRGQANVGNVTVVTGRPWFRTRLPVTRPIYWKVRAIDTAFRTSLWSAEQYAPRDTLTVTVLTDHSGPFTAYTNQTVLSVLVQDTTPNHVLRSFRVRNIGSLTNGEGRAGVVAVKLWQDVGTNNKRWSSQDIFVARLYWSPTAQAWTNGNISYPTQLGTAGKRFLVTVDLSSAVVWSNTFRAVLPANAVGCGVSVAPAAGWTNAGHLWTPRFLPVSAIPSAGLSQSSMAWGDYDNDGDLDLAVAGREESLPGFRIYRNDGNGTFTTVSISPAWGVENACLAWGDYDADGYLDLAVAGYYGVRQFRIYRNTGNGFQNINISPSWGFVYGDLAWGDYDNDGDMDLVLVGVDSKASNRFRLWRNEGNGTFTVFDPQPGWGVQYASVAWGDYDNDGDLDIVVAGFDNTQTVLRAFRNNNGVFEGEDLPGGGVQYASVAWGDYDADGDLDLAVIGRSGVTPVFRIYRNEGGNGFTDIGVSPTWGVYDGSVAWGDYDADGDLDVAVCGTAGAMTFYFRVYRNEGGGQFTDIDLSPNFGVWQGSLAWGDYDNDGDADLALSGGASTGRVLRIYRNVVPSVNLPPQPVVSGFAETNIGGFWRLRWNPATDDHTPQKALRYQIALGTNSAVYHVASAVVDFPPRQAQAGKVTVVTGQPWYQTRVPVTKPLYWKVCAIDTSFKVSDWSVERVSLPPAKVRAVHPGSNTAVATTTPRLVWTRSASPDVEEYHVWLDGMLVQVTTGTEHALSTPLAEGGHQWSVTVVTRNRATNLSGPWNFTVDITSPSAPVLRAPADASWVGTPTPMLAWHRATDGVSGISAYRVILDGNQAAVVPDSVTNWTPGTALGEGAHTWRVVAVDRAGNTNGSVLWGFTVDTVAPTAPTLVWPGNNLVISNGTPVLRWTGSSDAMSGVTNYQVILNGAVVGMVNHPVTNWALGPLADGGYTWRIKAYDRAGNTNTSVQWTFRVDRTKPSAPALLHPAHNKLTNALDLTVMWGASSDANGIQGYEVWTNGVLAGTVASNVQSYVLANIREGVHTWYVKAVDRAGNVSSSNARTFVIDRTPPVFAGLVSPVDGAFVTTNRPTLVWRRATDGNGITNYRVYVDGSLAGTVLHPVTNWVPGTGLSDGAHTWRVVAVDRAGNTNGSVQWTFHVTTGGLAAPMLVSPGNNSYVASANVVFVWTRSSSSLTNYRLIVNGAVVTTVPWTVTNAGRVLVDGVYTWQVRVVDKAGQSNVSVTWTVTVDTTAPGAFSLVSPLAGAYTNGDRPTLRWGASADANLGGYRVYTNGALAATVPAGTTEWTPPAAMREGMYSWHVVAYDLAGNTNGSLVWVFTVDRGAPSAPVPVSPADGRYTNAANPRLVWQRATDGGSGVSNYQVILNGSVVATVAHPVTNWVLGPLPDGVYTWRVKAYDRAGNTNGSVAWAFTVDTVPPGMFGLVTPTNGAVVSGTNTVFVWQRSADAHLEGYRLGLARLADNWRTNIALPLQTNHMWPGVLGQGVYRWWVEAYDRAGNRRDSSTNLFGVGVVALRWVEWPVRVSDGLRSYGLEESSTDASRYPLGAGLPIRMDFRLSGGVPAGADVRVQFLMVGPTGRTQVVERNARREGGGWEVVLPWDETKGKGGRAVLFRVVVDGDAVNMPLQGFVLRDMPSQSEAGMDERADTRVLNNAIVKGSGDRAVLVYTVYGGRRKVKVTVYTVAGEVVKDLVDGLQEEGTYLVEWDGRNGKGEAVGRGVYYVVVNYDGRRVPPMRRIVVK